MSTEIARCRKCGAQLPWDGGDATVTCSLCNTVNVLETAKTRARRARMGSTGSKLFRIFLRPRSLVVLGVVVAIALVYLAYPYYREYKTKQYREYQREISREATVEFGAAVATPMPKDLVSALSADARAGDEVFFGAYEQDGDEANGPEPIQWRVLETDGETAVLISVLCLDVVPYNDLYKDISWEECSARAFLNGAFLESAFDDAQRGKLVLCEVPAEPNPVHGTDGGNATQDYVYLLSYGEIMEYFPEQNQRMAQLTPYAMNKGGFRLEGDRARWWLRTVGNIQWKAISVSPNGLMFENGYVVTSSEVCVRPVVRISLK